MDIYHLIQTDHNTVNALFEKLVKTKDVATRRQLVRQVEEELLVHAKAEEETFYRALEKQNPGADPEVDHGKHEHDEIEACLADLVATNPADDRAFLDALDKLVAKVTHHVGEEESDIFAEARETFTDERARELANAMQFRKQELKKQGFPHTTHAAA